MIFLYHDQRQCDTRHGSSRNPYYLGFRCTSHFEINGTDILFFGNLS